jgi:glycosyltransferase involved in cell wall biosynthesis
MHIAHVLSSFGLGGQERMAVDLARAQRASGHRVMAVSLAPAPEGPLAETFLEAGVKALTVPKRAGFDVTLPIRLGQLFLREGVDVVHTHNPQPLIYGAPAGRFAGAALIHTKHGRNPDSLRRRLLRRAAAKLVDAYVAVSPSTAEVARENHDCDETRLHVITNGIDVTAFTLGAGVRCAVRDELGIPRDAWVVGTIGRLAPEKDQAALVRAMGPLLSEKRRLVIVGEGAERLALEELVRSLEHGRFVHLTGARRDPARLLAAFDVFGLSSCTEGLPLVLLEAMAAGLPVVSTDVGGIGDVIQHERTGFLVPRSSMTQFAEELLRLYRNPDLARRVGMSARHAVRNAYSLERMAGDYAALYANARRAALSSMMGEHATASLRA